MSEVISEHLSTIETAEDYNEYVYFYKSIRMALYTFAGKPVIVRNYIYEDFDETASLEMTINHTTYILEINRIDLKVYKTGIGLLSFNVLNSRYEEEEAIRQINTFSCCVYPPIMPIERARQRGFPEKIVLTLNKGLKIEEDFTHIQYGETLMISSLIMKVLGEPFINKINLKSTKEGLLIEPILGHQMFCCCMYYVPGLLGEVTNEKTIEENIAHLMHIHYTDVGKLKGEGEAITPYYIKSGNHVYGMNRRMLFGLLEEYPCEKLYDQLVKLVLMQRATLLNLSSEIARVSTLPKSEISSAISSIYEIYIQFINQLYFKEVTEDGEGSMLYAQLSKIFMIEDELNQLNSEVDEVHEYASLVEQAASNFKVQLLTIIGAALVLPSFVTGFFGMNIFQEEAAHWWRHYPVALWLNSYVILPILAVVAICTWTKRRTVLARLLKVLLAIFLITSLSFAIKFGSGL